MTTLTIEQEETYAEPVYYGTDKFIGKHGNLKKGHQENHRKWRQFRDCEPYDGGLHEKR